LAERTKVPVFAVEVSRLESSKRHTDFQIYFLTSVNCEGFQEIRRDEASHGSLNVRRTHCREFGPQY